MAHPVSFPRLKLATTVPYDPEMTSFLDLHSSQQRKVYFSGPLDRNIVRDSEGNIHPSNGRWVSVWVQIVGHTLCVEAVEIARVKGTDVLPSYTNIAESVRHRLLVSKLHRNFVETWRIRIRHISKVDVLDDTTQCHLIERRGRDGSHPLCLPLPCFPDQLDCGLQTRIVGARSISRIVYRTPFQDFNQQLWYAQTPHGFSRLSHYLFKQ